MATLIFDFDSTLVTCETLEELVAGQLEGDPSRADRYRAMTEAGMSGGWTFAESLAARLSIAAPGLADIEAFTARLEEVWTEGMPDLVRKLHRRGHEVWIVSGAPLEVVRAAGARLGVPRDRVRGVRLLWDPKGRFLSVDPGDPFARSKVEGLAGLAGAWERPRLMIGDGLTDRAVYDQGLVDHFIPFTAHVRREIILRGDIQEARSTSELETLIESHS